ncbi:MULTISPECIES: hypothetical protein [Ralstonia solanacearum species complex]|uniref:hypothetical protein n=1 Tax=Ralstonia solanacearum species complex TaxID=3116862 RepID=UPI000E590A2F|nr:hypothetical protein [Ralstonia solanacearum]BEU75012.1 hypothetical protein MAFF211271_45670 [Ralstonia pseudosolanacearum]AXV79799.1 hypothetical protein CJO76_23310 [Ralstonia solanacearum]AXV93830.1 hypothetical protein CJO79_23290 [Ralstonia solanacearum]AXW21823.1 hypothetical protein CJO85_23415 [Ralstonia solanacearum]AXW78724.1 hypothetical protein CJO97_23290 [Ralstonia solanacearum]
MKKQIYFKQFTSILSGLIFSVGALTSIPAPAGEQHLIAVTSSASQPENWSVYADLYDGKGNKIYHWQETGHKGGRKDYLRWNYTDGGDRGWLNIWIDHGGKREAYLKLPLNQDHCFSIEPQTGNSPSYVQSGHC